MKTRDYWKNYLCETDAVEIERNLRQTTFKSRNLSLSLKYFEKSKYAPNILWVVGTGCYSLYLAELGYHMYLRGFNTFGIDFQGHGDSEGERGDFTLSELVRNCIDATAYISNKYKERVGAVGVSMGGFVTFYLGLSYSAVKSISCLNPGIVTEKAFKDEVTRLRKAPPLAGVVARLFPGKMIPTERCVDFMGLAGTEGEKRHVVTYLNDPTVVRSYTLRAVIWDMDGVIADTSALHYAAWQDVLGKWGIVYTKEAFQLNCGKRTDSIVRSLVGCRGSQQDVESIKAEKEARYRERAHEKVSALPGAVELLRSLERADFLQALASSAHKEDVEFSLGRLGIRGYFPVIVSGWDVRQGKPNPQCFLMAAERLGVIPKECVVIEDAVVGVSAAKSAGMCCLAVTTTNPREKLSEADLVVNSLADVTVADIEGLMPVHRSGRSSSK
jgi:beta-phosphoglucomutase